MEDMLGKLKAVASGAGWRIEESGGKVHVSLNGSTVFTLEPNAATFSFRGANTREYVDGSSMEREGDRVVLKFEEGSGWFLVSTTESAWVSDTGWGDGDYRNFTENVYIRMAKFVGFETKPSERDGLPEIVFYLDGSPYSLQNRYLSSGVTDETGIKVNIEETPRVPMVSTGWCLTKVQEQIRDQLLASGTWESKDGLNLSSGQQPRLHASLEGAGGISFDFWFRRFHFLPREQVKSFGAVVLHNRNHEHYRMGSLVDFRIWEFCLEDVVGFMREVGEENSETLIIEIPASRFEAYREAVEAGYIAGKAVRTGAEVNAVAKTILFRIYSSGAGNIMLRFTSEAPAADTPER